MSGDFHCKCDKGQPDKPCRIFDGNDELYHNSLLARQIAEILTNGGVAGVSVQDACQGLMDCVESIKEADNKINSMIISLDDIRHPSLAYMKISIQIANATVSRNRLKEHIFDLYGALGRLIEIECDIVPMRNFKKACSY